MKIIDLLVKINKGEEVPKIVEYRNWNNNGFNKMLVCYENIIDKLDKKEIFLNDEVEIIEEEKEIEKGIKPYKQYVEELGKDGYGLSKINEEYLDRLSKIVIELINDMRDKE